MKAMSSCAAHCPALRNGTRIPQRHNATKALRNFRYSRDRIIKPFSSFTEDLLNQKRNLTRRRIKRLRVRQATVTAGKRREIVSTWHAVEPRTVA